MVAGNGHIIAHGVHDVDDSLALGHGADRLALDSVAVVHEKHIIILLKAFLRRIQAGIAPALVNAAVYIAGEKDHEIPLLRGNRGFFRISRDAQGGQHNCDKNQCEYLLFHAFPPFIAPPEFLQK